MLESFLHTCDARRARVHRNISVQLFGEWHALRYRFTRKNREKESRRQSNLAWLPSDYAYLSGHKATRGIFPPPPLSYSLVFIGHESGSIYILYPAVITAKLPQRSLLENLFAICETTLIPRITRAHQSWSRIITTGGSVRPIRMRQSREAGSPLRSMHGRL